MSRARTGALPESAGSILSDDDVYLFNEGTHRHLADKLGAHLRSGSDGEGVHFSVWAPNASSVAVIGDFNGWDGRADPMTLRANAGVWEVVVEAARAGDIYK
jgi:1,4-alpha-glucan branching enzyme